jgi:ADP-dependent NAD(P)H-hydrate dehydratase / NAD(P)H-hydrate epimerase
MHVVDPNAEFRGISVTKLMNRAGKEARKAILRKWKNPKKIQIFCGGGNNGGDGFALAAEFLAKKIKVEVILAVPVNKIRTPAAQHHFQRVPKKIISQFSAKTKFDGEILIDALLGIGAAGSLKKPFDTIVQKLMKAEGNLVSLDITTSSKLKPKLVVAFHSSKNSKNEVVVPIGIPKIAETHFGPGDVIVNFPRRKLDSHKGKNGKVVIVGGSRDYLGAPIFAGLGALSSGADLVYVWVPKVNFAATRKASPNFLVKSFRGDSEKLTPTAVDEILDFTQKEKIIIVLGCGLGKNIETKKAVLEIVKKTTQPLILDADAIIPELITLTLKPNTILTPHTGEWQRIPKKMNAVILKKGRIDEIISPDGRQRWNDQGNPILTVGGTGDVLAGIVGGLLAREVKPFEAAGIAAFLVGLAGKKIAVKSESLTPQMLAKKIPKIICEIFNQKF